MSPHTKVAAVVLTYNSKGVIDQCLKALEEHRDGAHVIVVDNDSGDGTAGYVREQYPEVEVVQNHKNLGYAGAYNKVLYQLQQKGYGFAVLINPDFRIGVGCIRSLVRAMKKDERAGIAAPKMYRADPPNVLYFAGADYNWPGWSEHVGVGEVDSGQYDRSRESYRVNGACMIVNLGVLEKAGGMDERFFLYFEESEWCLRVRKAGYKILYVAEAQGWHAQGSSSGDTSTGYAYYMTRNQMWFVKWQGQSMSLAFHRNFWTKRVIGSCWKFVRKGNWPAAWAVWRGVLDYYLGRIGKKRPLWSKA